MKVHRRIASSDIYICKILFSVKKTIIIVLHIVPFMIYPES